jgi:hypothetical protein
MVLHFGSGVRTPLPADAADLPGLHRWARFPDARMGLGARGVIAFATHRKRCTLSHLLTTYCPNPWPAMAFGTYHRWLMGAPIGHRPAPACPTSSPHRSRRVYSTCWQPTGTNCEPRSKLSFGAAPWPIVFGHTSARRPGKTSAARLFP